ncbi:MAG: 50S ribosomal protein L13 [Chitinophagales bacterium]|nr:50S ribosomal protein L13 [Chitinophagales bacterium]
MKTLSYKTDSVYIAEGDRKWYVIDAEDQTLGRLCSRISLVLQGKHKPSYTPHVDTGDHIIVINAEKIVLTGNKVEDKQYIWHTGYPGGQRFKTPKQVLQKDPAFLIENAVKGMLPRTRLGRAMYAKLHVYAGTAHPHAAQKPEKLKLL